MWTTKVAKRGCEGSCCRSCLHAPAAGPRPPSPCRVGRLRWADNGKELLDRDLLPECLFILQPRAAWSEPFDAGWSGARAEAWGAHNAHAKLTPETVTKGSDAYALWRCARAGHVWTTVVVARATTGTGCRACLHAPGTLAPELRAECVAVLGPCGGWSEPFCGTWSAARSEVWAGRNKHASLTPASVTRGSGFHALWECGAGHRWTAMVNNRSKGNGCKQCSNQ